MANPPAAPPPGVAALPEKRGFLDVLQKNSDLGLAAVVVIIVGMMIIPLPVFLLDIFICANMAGAVILLLLAIYIPEALRIATFPTLLLLTTLFRLALEVSATRLILLHADAGHVIEAFGRFVVSGNLVVGAVIFFILTMIQFIVIAKGSERVSEVGARFTLDAMPGKQMSIDAELRAGAIDHTEARRRRSALGRESQFFGSMDGAMKFVKGDAIAGIIVLLANIVGGLIIGIVQKGMDAGVAAQKYTVLTIGEGLVSQIPALIISTAAGIIVTRVASEEEGSHLGKEILGQLTGQPKALMIAGGLMVLLAIVPGFPPIPFLLLAGLLGFIGWKLQKAHKEAAAAETAAALAKLAPAAPGAAAPAVKPAGTPAAPAGPPQPILVPIVVELSSAVTEDFFPDGTAGNFFEEVVPQMRGDFFTDMGIVLPGVRLKGHIPNVPATDYQFLLFEALAARGTPKLGCSLVLAPNEALVEKGLQGERALLPDGAHGVWLPNSEADRARELGFKVLTGPEAMIRHLSHVCRRHARELVSIEETQQLLDGVSRTHPALVKEVVPKLVALPLLTDILRRLVEEGVSLRGLVDVLGALGEWAPIERDPVALTEHVRGVMRRRIVAQYLAADETLQVFVLDPIIEETIRDSIQRTPTGNYLALDPAASRGIVKAVSASITGLPTPVVLTSSEIRRFVRRLLESEHPNVAVLSYQELPAETKIKQVGRIKSK